MRKDFKAFLRSAGLIFILILPCKGTDAQILNDPASISLIKKGISHMYNFQFSEAREIIEEINQMYPDHPALLLLNSVITYWENYPMLPSSTVRASFEKNLRRCIEVCENKEGGDNDAEYLLIDLCSRGLLLLFLSDNDLNLEVFPLALSTYQYIRHSFDYISVYYDFNYFAGVFDYYREEYPEAYPVYKPLAALFPKGSRIRGLKELNLAADSSIFLRAESLSVLEDLYLRFENNYEIATSYNKKLYDLYPGNPEYRDEYIKSLLIVKDYDKAETIINSVDSLSENSFFNGQIEILSGILSEKKNHNLDLAQSLYIRGIAHLKPYGKYADEFSAYAYFGLSRISEANGEKHLAKKYHREAGSLSAFKKINFD
jgi:tetratricopeptide (TPR) repeat protein